MDNDTDAMVERVALALRVNRVGEDAALRSRETNSAGWQGALSDARAALSARDERPWPARNTRAAPSKGEPAANPCSAIFDHKWLSPSCVADGCRSLNTRLLLGIVMDMQPPDDCHTDAWHLGFARARKMAADLVRATLDPAVAGQADPEPVVAKGEPADEVDWKDAKAIAAAVVQSACETDPADPTHPDTIQVLTDDLETIVRNTVENHFAAHRLSAERARDAEVADNLRDAVVAAYIQGATDVHNNWQEDRDPDFTEAAHDYAADAIEAGAIRDE